jgi:DNA-binding phage protein
MKDTNGYQFLDTLPGQSFDVADYLDTPEMIAAYLDQCALDAKDDTNTRTLANCIATAVIALRRLQANEEARLDGTAD